MQMSCILYFYSFVMELSPFLWTLIWNTVIAIWIIIVVFLVKFIKDKLIDNLEYITATTVWLILAIVFLWFLPELVSDWFDGEIMWIYILIWIMLFYLFELFLHWHHCRDLDHNSHCHSSHTHDHKNWTLMFWATMLHNSFHWVVLFTAFSVNTNFWIATTIALLLHAIPQNIANYIMNHNNIKFAYFAAIWGLLWAIITYPIADFLVSKEWYVLSIISWWLLYTALADIFPEFKGKWTISKKIIYLFFIIIGVVLFLWFESMTVH
jgi:zinc and cadmium transporter